MNNNDNSKVRIQAIEHDSPDLRKLARALIRLARDQQALDAKATTDKSSEPETENEVAA